MNENEKNVPECGHEGASNRMTGRINGAHHLATTGRRIAEHSGAAAKGGKVSWLTYNE
ncbi:MAG: hypothetical protein QM755_06130 [Luteolibacter sp.]